jgi:RNase P/RNase MRP subunit POP5
LFLEAFRTDMTRIASLRQVVGHDEGAPRISRAKGDTARFAVIVVFTHNGKRVIKKPLRLRRG